MFESVKSAIGGSGITTEDGGLILVSETATTSANGLVTHFLTSSVANNHPVCFVTLQQTWGHYCNIGNRLGLNLRQHSDLCNVKVIDGLKLLSEVLDGTVTDINHPFNFLFSTCEYPLRNFYNLIKKAVQPWKDDGKYFMIIIENVNCLLNMGIHTKDVEVFINYCRNLIGDCVNEKSGSLVVVTTADEKDEDASHVTKTLAHAALIHLSSRGLSTGLSREVHGDLKITAFDRYNPHHCLPNIHQFQYKMEEKNMKLFAPGTSANLL